MVTQSRRLGRSPAGFHGNHIDPHRQHRQRRPVRQAARFEEPTKCGAKSCSLPPANGFLGEAEAAFRAEADLDEDQCGRRPRIDRDHIDLGAADMDVAAQDLPAIGDQPRDDHILTGVAAPLRVGPGSR